MASTNANELYAGATEPVRAYAAILSKETERVAEPPTLNVIAPGTAVGLAGGLRATVAQIIIEDKGLVSYKVLWIDGGTINEFTVPEYLILSTEPGTVRIGFGARS